jgi:ABC-type molybdate transport system permease subunit
VIAAAVVAFRWCFKPARAAFEASTASWKQAARVLGMSEMAFSCA